MTGAFQTSDGRPLRVAIVAASPGIIGGHSVQAAQLARALARDGAVVELVPIDLPPPPGLGWVRRLRGVRTLVNECGYALSLRRLARADVVHVFSASYWAFLLAAVPPMAAGRALGKRVVLHYHSGEVVDHLAHWGWRVHPWLRLADRIVVCSEFQRAAFARFGHQARAIPNIVDPVQFSYRDRARLRPRFVCTRNFEPYYRVDAVIDAFAAVHRVRPDATLTVAGDGSLARDLRVQAARAGHGGIRFVGAVPPAQMPALLDDADVFLNASVVDNQPLSLIEAAAAGLPIVTTPAGGIGEMVEHGRSGWLLPGPDPRAIAHAALELLARPGWARAMARRAHHRLGRYAWETVRSHWADVYGVGDLDRSGARLQEPAAAQSATSAPSGLHA